jgi:hypothetical protein
MATPAEEETITYWVVLADDSTDSDSGDDDESAQTCVVNHVEIRCYRARGTGPPRSAGGATTGPPGANQHPPWVIERHVSPVRISARLRGTVAGAVKDDLANTISTRVFGAISDQWVVQDPGRLGASADQTAQAGDGLHQILLGAPAEKVSSALGVTGPVPSIVGGVAGQLPLPIDGPFGFIKALAQVAGMAIGVATGVPLLATASCKSFVHDQVTQGIARALSPEPSSEQRTRHSARPGRPIPGPPIQGRTRRKPRGDTGQGDIPPPGQR